MSSLEIAELTGKDHKNVLADVRNMLNALKFSTAEFSAMKKAGNGREYEVYNLPRDLTETLITGYSIPLRHRVVVRLRELEAQVAKPFQVPTTLLGALQLAAELEEQRTSLAHQVETQVQKITADKPKVDYYKKVRESVNTETIGDFAKKLEFGEIKLFKWLRKQNILMADNSPYQRHIDAEHFRVLDKETEKNGKVITYSQTVLTGKGKTYVQRRLARAGNPDLTE